MTTKEAGNVDLALCNDSTRCERTLSDRIFSDYDLAIVKRLQYLTQRVEDLERKLEKRMPVESDDLSFALSVDNNNSVPNVDIKVLTGPRESYYNSTADEDLMGGWDDGIVERNTSFLIIPVGDDKDSQFSEAQRLKQTFDGTLENTASSPALCLADTYREIIDGDEDNESIRVKKAISVSTVHPSGNHKGNTLDSETLESICDSNSIKNSECLSDDTTLKITAGKEKIIVYKREMEELSDQQAIEEAVGNMDKLDISNKQANDGTLKYGYTISVSGVGAKTPPIQQRVFDFESNVSLREREMTLDKRGSVNGVVSQEETKLDSKVPCYVVKSKVLPTAENIMNEDIGIQEMYERNDNDHVTGIHKHNNIEEAFNHRPIKIDPSLSKQQVLNQNFVKSHTCNSQSLDKQLMRPIRRESAVSGSMTDASSIEKEVEEITSRVNKPMITVGVKDKEKRKMQIAPSRLTRCKDWCCPDNGSDEPCVVSNTTAVNGLINNTNNNTENLKEIAVDWYASNDLQNDPRQRHMYNKSVPRKVRVRSLELPLTSSEEDLSPTMVGRGAHLWNNPRTNRPQRRKPRNKTSKSSTARNDMSCRQPVNLEENLKQLIDPCKIGNLHEEMAADKRSLLLAVMSPTDSGYVGSNTDSPRDAWKDYEGPGSMPVSIQRSSYPNSLYSSPPITPTTYSRVVAVPNERPVREEKQQVVFLSSVGSHSSTSSTVSYIGGSECSEISSSEDRDVYPSDLTMPCPLPACHTTSGLHEYFTGPTSLSLDNYSSNVGLNEYLLNRHRIASPTSSVGTSELSDSFFDCQSDYCECQTGIATEQDFREEIKSISRYVLEAREKTEVVKKPRKSLRSYYLDEEQGEMDIFGARLQKGDHKAVPMLVKVILRLRKHFFGGIEGPTSLKSLSPRQEKCSAESGTRERKISFSPSAMLLSAVGESSASEIRDVIEKDRLDVNQLSPSGKSLLHKAASRGDLESIHTLIQYGATVNLSDQDGFAPLHCALRRCHYKCAIFLMECGTDMTAYTRARVHELSIIKNMSSEYMRTVLSTPL